MNVNEIEKYIFNYLLDIYGDFCIMAFRKKMSEPVFQSTKDRRRADTWKHSVLSTNERMYIKINIGALNREVIMKNIIHLLIHMKNQEEGICDIAEFANRGYHNIKFADAAKRRGIECRHEKNYGYQILKIPNEMKIECMNIINRYYTDIEDYLRIYDAVDNITSETNRSQDRQYATYKCPVCNKRIKAWKNAYIICGVDMVPFERI